MTGSSGPTGATFGNGLAYALFCLFVVGVVTFAVLHLAYLSLVSTVVVSAFLLKSTFAIRSMLQHVNGVLDSLDRGGDVQEARMRLSRLVRRDTSRMGGFPTYHRR
ncbi:cobalamin biosynthesis protein [Thermogymnomonas acidicola]|uniref:cobalamin biosynthesis protein n=1 Tax=Thermogymnomonas acidicola TaxID=399579 RepID=UPI000946802E|nr:cobalamin biosynthesis protein [Thermogymnomonas acidicola]